MFTQIKKLRGRKVFLVIRPFDVEDVGRNSLFVYSGHVVVVFLASYFIVSSGLVGNRPIIVLFQFVTLAILMGATALKQRYLPDLP